MTHTVKGFSIVDDTEVDIFLEFSYFFLIQPMLAVWSLVPLPFLSPAVPLEVRSHVLVEPRLEDFEHHLAACEMSALVPCAQSLRRLHFFATPWTIAHQTSLSMRFSRQEYWSRLPFLSPENCVVAWTFFGIALLWDWNENWHFPVLWPLSSFLSLLIYWEQHFNSTIF